MAKIYETKEDFQRDQLNEEAAHLRLKASHQNHTAATFIVGSLFADVIRMGKPETRNWLGWVSWAATFGAIVEWVRGWKTSSKAEDVERHARVLGPERVVLPPDVMMDTPPIIVMAADKPCAPCKTKPFSQSIASKTLAEHAAEQTLDPSLKR